MDVVRLPVGQQAPVDSDCIRIEQTAVKTFELTGSALCSDDGTEDSVSIAGGPVFDSAAKAEAAGLAWAANAGVTRLIIIKATLDQPFELLEIDKPL